MNLVIEPKIIFDKFRKTSIYYYYPKIFVLKQEEYRLELLFLPQLDLTFIVQYVMN